MTVRNKNAGLFRVGDLVRFKSTKGAETIHMVTKVTPPDTKSMQYNFCDSIEFFPPANNEPFGTTNWSWSDHLQPT